MPCQPGSTNNISLTLPFFFLYKTKTTILVDAGEAAVVFDKLQDGIQEEVYGEGMHFRIPFVQQPYIYNIRVQPRVFANSTQSKDLQTVSIETRILYRPMKDRLPQIYRQLGMNYDDRVLKSIAEEVIKSVVADYDAEVRSKNEESFGNVKYQCIDVYMLRGRPTPPHAEC